MTSRAIELNTARDYLATENIAGIEAAVREMDEQIADFRATGLASRTDRGRQWAIRKMNRLESIRERLLAVADANRSCNGYRNAGLAPWIPAGSLCPCPKAIHELRDDEAA